MSALLIWTNIAGLDLGAKRKNVDVETNKQKEHAFLDSVMDVCFKLNCFNSFKFLNMSVSNLFMSVFHLSEGLNYMNLAASKFYVVGGQVCPTYFRVCPVHGLSRAWSRSF